MPDWIECELGQILMSDNPAYEHVLVLREKDGSRRFHIIVGGFEAAAIRRWVHSEILPRPMTHDLLMTLLAALGGELRQVAVSDLVEDGKGAGVYHGLLTIARGGTETLVDCRPSDALAMAVRAGCPIFVSREVLEKAAAI